MTTSGITAWELTARDVISAALCDELGIYGFGEDVPAEAVTFAMGHLNSLLKAAGEGAHLETEGTVTIPANDASGAIAGNVSEVISARLVSGVNERILARFGRDEYLSIPNKDASGEPTCFYVSNQRDNVLMYVWPVPTVETTVRTDYRRIPETVTDASETIDFPPQYHPALIENLAVRCAGRFNVQPNQRPELFSRAARHWQEMEDQERPASYMLGPY
jgi:hypothetical protein